MSMIFKFRALSDENDNFVRDYELNYSDSLLDFHNFICENLCFDKSAMASFFTSDKQWDKLKEYTLMDMADSEGPPTMGSASLDGVIHDNGDRLIYIFDMFGDRALYIEMMGAYKPEDDAKYPQVALSEGDAPDQFDASFEESGNNSMFDEALGEFGSFEGDDNYDDVF